MYTITNTGLSNRVVPTALGQVVIQRGTKRDKLSLHPGTAQHLRRAQMRGEKVVIEGENEQARAVLEDANNFRRGFNIHGNLQTRPVIIGAPAPVQDRDEIAEEMRKLIELCEVEGPDKMKFTELRARAQILLGSRWPSGIGVAGRKQVAQLLRDALSVDETEANKVEQT